MARLPFLRPAKPQPRSIDQSNLSGNRVTWSMTFALPPLTINVGGLIRYHGVSVDGEYTVYGAVEGQPPIDRTMLMCSSPTTRSCTS